MGNAQAILTKKYGDPRPSGNYLKKFCMAWAVKQDFPWFPIAEFEVNKDFHTMLFKAFTSLQAAGLHTEIKTFDGCYNYRKVRGKGSLSLHSWAAAIDLNALTEKLGQVKSGWSQPFIDVMIKSGLSWGGNFKSRKDPMHFAMFNG